MDEISNKSKEEAIKENLDGINLRFFEWLKKILEFDISRTLQLNTFLINFFIVQNYFHSVEELYRILPQLLPESFRVEEIKAFRINYERIFSIFILIVLTFKSRRKLSKGKTTQQIEALHSYGPLVIQFFTINSLPPNLQIADLDLLMTQVQKSMIVENLLPHLEFDPLFQEILNSDAIRHLFFTSTPQNLLNLDMSKDLEESKYLPEPYIYLENLEARKNVTKI